MAEDPTGDEPDMKSNDTTTPEPEPGSDSSDGAVGTAGEKKSVTARAGSSDKTSASAPRAARSRTTPKGTKPGQAAKKVGKDAKGAERGPERSRITAPAPKHKPPSPTWYYVVTLGSFAVGVLVILANYIGTFGSTSNAVLGIGLAIILVGFILATRLR